MDNKLRIMVFGAESFGYSVPKSPIEEKKYTLEFCSIRSDREFTEFDIVIFFDKAFEEFSRDSIHCSNKDEMLKRTKQAFALISKGGVICSLVYAIKDEYKISSGYAGVYTYDSYDTSLLKVILNDIGIRKNDRHYSTTAMKHFKTIRNEYITYLMKYGVTETYFDIPHNYHYSVKPICKVDRYYAGIIINDQIILLPCLAPDKSEKSTKELFVSIAIALIETVNKISTDLPAWVNEQVTLPEEQKLLKILSELNQTVKELESNIKHYHSLKSILCLSGEALVDSTSFTLDTFLNIKTEKPEEFVDDLKLYIPDAKGSLTNFAIAEVKGINSGVKREHINQADSHRERLALPHDFPALLIVNTKMNATDLKEKDLEISSEQIKKAVSDNILIMRTIDLLDLIFLIEKGKITRDEIIKIFKTEKGWLKATQEEYIIVHE